jgi:Tol biopolymer transport system component
VEVDIGRLRKISDHPAPDGRYLLFNSNRDLALNEFRVYVLDIETGEVWPLIPDDKISTGTSERNGI